MLLRLHVRPLRPARLLPLLGALLVVALHSASVAAQPTVSARLAAIDDSVRAMLVAGSPGVAIGIVRDGQIAHTRYAGEADLSHHVAVGPATRFNIASNAKQFTAAVVLSLIQDGRLSLDRRVQDILPNALPLVKTPITVRQLLTHTSGIRDVYDLWSLSGITWWQSFVGNEEAFDLLRRQRTLNFTPGTDYLYSNSNYLLLVAIAAAVTDSSFADISASRLRAWGLPSSGYQTDGLQVIPNRARPYGGGKTWQEYPAVTSTHGDGGLFTTLPDQLAWEVRIQQAAGEQAPSIWKTLQSPVDGASTRNYGYGVEHSSYAGLPYLFHDGSTGAYNATFLRFPSRRFAVVVMSNNGSLGVHALAVQYANAMLGDDVATRLPYPARPERIGAPVDPTPWLGDYRASTGALISLARTDSGLVRRIPGSPDVRLLADTGNIYRYATNASLKMALDRDSAGTPRFTIYLPTQQPNVGTRLKPAPRRLAASAWIGRYVNDETNSQLSIATMKDDRVTGTLNGRPVTGALVRSDIVSLSGYELTPVLGSTGAVVALSLSGGRVRNVAFRRLR